MEVNFRKLHKRNKPRSILTRYDRHAVERSLMLKLENKHDNEKLKKKWQKSFQNLKSKHPTNLVFLTKHDRTDWFCLTKNEKWTFFPHCLSIFVILFTKSLKLTWWIWLQMMICWGSIRASWSNKWLTTSYNDLWWRTNFNLTVYYDSIKNSRQIYVLLLWTFVYFLFMHQFIKLPQLLHI